MLSESVITYTLLGIGLVAVTVVVHAVGTTWWLRWLGAHFRNSDQRYSTGRTLRVLVGTIVVLLALHTVQIFIWAFAYLHLLPATVLSTIEEATYFSFVTFTTLGYGDITLQGVWRIMSGIEALNGIILVGWSTALLFAVVQRTWQDMTREQTGQ